ncbi:MAG: hypothetical protein AAF585_21875, partial [Verrucomicrobiota bacterium]
MINILKADLDPVPYSEFKTSILDQLDDLEQEAKKKTPRWGPIIAGFFILVGAIADAKTMNPHIYDRPFEIAHSILNLIQDEGMVSVASDPSRLPGPEGDVPTLQPASLPPPRESEIEESQME